MHTPWRRAGRRERTAAAAEVAALLDALPDSERAMWGTAFYAGLRRGELRSLTWAHIDLDAGTIRVENGCDDDEGRIDVKSDAGERTVPILAPLRPLLVAHRLATGRHGDALVFGRTDREPFVPATARARAAERVEGGRAGHDHFARGAARRGSQRAPSERPRQSPAFARLLLLVRCRRCAWCVTPRVPGCSRISRDAREGSELRGLRG